MLRKKLVAYFVVAALLNCCICLAQKQLFIGVKGGISIPNLHGGSKGNPVAAGWSSRLGPYAGLAAVYKLSQKFSVQGEINYASQGGKKKGKQAIATTNFFDPVPPGIPLFVYANYDQEIKVNYLELPILLKWNLTIHRQLNFFVNAGPYFSYFISGKSISSGLSKVYADENETTPLTSQQVSFDADLDIKDEIKKFNAGVQFGIGLWQQFAPGALMLTIGGNYGLVPIQKNKDNGSNNTGNATISLGYFFKIN